MKNLILVVALLPSLTLAKSWTSDDYGALEVSGYAGYRYIYSSIDLFPIDSGPELGLLATWDINDNWTVFTQFSYENEKPLDNTLVYGFVEYKRKLFDYASIKLTGGLLRHQSGLFNEQRINPRTRPGGTIESQVLYWSQLRRTTSSGVGLKGELTYKDITVGYSYTKPEILNPEEEALIWSTIPGSMIESNFGGIRIANLNYHPSNKNWQIKSSYSHVNLGKYNDDNHIFFLGYEYIGDNWDASIEGSMVKTTQVSWSDYDNDFGWGLYARGDYDVNDWLSVRLGYSHYRPGQKTINNIVKALNLPTSVTRSDDIGVGFTAHKNSWEFKTDIHYVKGGNFIPVRNWSTSKDMDDWWYVGTSLVYHFD